MKIMFVGDVVGHNGRKAFRKYTPELRAERGIDVVVVNGENSARSEERRVGKECRSRWSPYH